jgi:hypothetical protein
VFITATPGMPAVVQNLQVRAYALETAVTVQVHVDDPTSIANYGVKTWPSDRDPVWASAPDALGIAALILGQRAQRLPTVSVTFKGAIRQRLLEQLSRDLSDRVRIVDPGAYFDADFYVEHIEHTAGDTDLETRFGCEMVPAAAAGLLILDDATYGLLNTATLGGVGVSAPSTVFLLDSPTQGLLNDLDSLLGY